MGPSSSKKFSFHGGGNMKMGALSGGAHEKGKPTDIFYPKHGPTAHYK